MTGMSSGDHMHVLTIILISILRQKAQIIINGADRNKIFSYEPMPRSFCGQDCAVKMLFWGKNVSKRACIASILGHYGINARDCVIFVRSVLLVRSNPEYGSLFFCGGTGKHRLA